MNRNISETGKKKRKQASKKVRRRRRRSKFFLYLLLLLFVLITAVTLSLTVFFGITDLRIEGDFDKEQILGAISVKEGDNLFLTSSEEIEEEILSAFLDADNVTVNKELPGTVTITVEKAVPSTAFLQGETYCIVSQNGRVLQSGATELPEGVVRIEGLKLPDDSKVGTFVDPAQDETYSVVQQIYNGLTQAGVEQINCIRVEDLFDLEAVVDGRLLVKFGNVSELDYKVKFAAEVINTQIGAEETGTLNASVSGKVNFIPLREGETIQ